MAQSTSNILANSTQYFTNPSSTPQASALNNKINPQPITPLVGNLAPSYNAASSILNPSNSIQTSTPQTTNGFSGSLLSALKNQPVNTSSFTPAQLAAFNAANALGSGVATTGSNQNTSTSNSGTSTPPPIVNPNASFNANAGVSTGAGVPTPGGGGGTTNPGVTYPGLVAQVANNASQPSAAYTQAENQYQQDIAAYNQSVQNEAGTIANNNSQPIPLEFQQGRNQVAQTQYTAQQAGLGGLVQGASAALGAANTQGQIQQQGLLGAAGLAAPQPYGLTTTAYNPQTGQYGPVAGVASMGGTGANGLQSVGNIQGQIGVGETVAQQNAFLGSAQTTGQNLQNLITQNNINPAAFTPANGLIQTAAQYTSNPAYQEFAGQINDFVSKIAPILGGAAGATTDYKTQLAGSILNSVQSGQSINDVISYFLNQAKQNIQGYSQGGGAGVGSAGGSTGSGGTVTAGGYTFVQNADGTYSPQ